MTGTLPSRLFAASAAYGRAAGVGGAVGEEYAIRLELEHFFRRGVGGNHMHVHAADAHGAQNVPFDAEVIGDDIEVRRRKLIPAFPRNASWRDPGPSRKLARR